MLFGTAEVTGVDVFAAIRDEPGNVSVKTIGQEAFRAAPASTPTPCSRRR